MRAALIDKSSGSARLSLTERQIPRPAAGEILVRVEAASLNYRDLLVIDGIGRWNPPAGRIPGSDACGIVTEIGPGVEGLKPGDRIVSTILPNWLSGSLSADKLQGSLGGAAADGVFAEYVLLRSNSVVVVDDRMTSEELATLPCAALTAWQALQRASSLAPGKTVLLEGTGGVSIFALQMVVAAGAKAVITSSNDEKLAKALELGASAGINYRTSSDWVEKAMSLSPDGYDHVLDVGGASTLSQSIALAAYEGTVSIIGLIGGLEATIDLTPVFAKNLKVDGIEVGSRAMLAELVEWYGGHNLRPVIDRVFGLDEINLALDHLRSGSHFGKVVVKFA
ncbi:MAG TPA: NAD(P)-dependent alcohol dehydrogenase [Sphingomicrobium sp.]|nr:NAD(P)-dependent alcohol dehydrogenase [Sphingomicrobium sp.]